MSALGQHKSLPGCKLHTTKLAHHLAAGLCASWWCAPRLCVIQLGCVEGHPWTMKNTACKTARNIQNWAKTSINQLIPIDRKTLTHCGLVTQYAKNRFGSTFAPVMAYCLLAPSHYLYQCWLFITWVLSQSHKSNLQRNTHDMNRYHHSTFELCVT